MTDSVVSVRPEFKNLLILPHLSATQDPNQMITFSSESTWYSVTSNGVTQGAVYVTPEAAQSKADALNHEWGGKRTFSITSYTQDTFTAHER